MDYIRNESVGGPVYLVVYQLPNGYELITRSSNLQTSWAWRIPTIVQAGLPSIVMVLILLFPESPRWLIAHDRADEALAIFARYHGDGNPDSPLAQLQYREVMEQNALARNDNPWWDFRELVNTPAARYRLYMVIAMSFFGQWSGNNVVSYFMPSMIKSAASPTPTSSCSSTPSTPSSP